MGIVRPQLTRALASLQPLRWEGDVVDRHGRAELALKLRRLASGRLPAPEFEDAYYDLEHARPADRALSEVAYFGWTLFGDWDDRLVGQRAVRPGARRAVARAVLFLGTDREYPWPPHPPPFTWRDLAAVLTLGRVQWKHPAWGAWRRAVDFEVWPFATRADLVDAARRWPFRATPDAPAV